MEIVYDLLQALLGLVFPGNVGKFDAFRGFDVDLGIGFSKSKGHGIGAAGPVHHFFGHELPDGNEDQQRQNPRQQKAQNGRFLLNFLPVKRDAGVMKTGRQIRIVHHGGFIDGGLLLVCKENEIFLLLNFYPAYLTVFRHGHEGAVVHLHHLPLGELGQGQEVKQQQNQHNHAIVVD